jgi:hypothetical protein
LQSNFHSGSTAPLSQLLLLFWYKERVQHPAI